MAQDASYDHLCSIVLQDFLPCMNFLGGQLPNPENNCCDNIKKLNRVAATFKFGSRRICQCIEDFTDVMKFQFIPSRIEALPGKCHQLHHSFPISIAMDCSKVN
ncbi:hypothetical protein Ancab_011041 [Ancistrocladus abbreviatus]